jgi:ketosteroid isomerase-like protein
MSRENVEIVRGMHEHMKGLNLAVQGDDPEDQRELIEQVYAPDIEASWSSTNPEARTYRGYEGLMKAFGEWMESFEEYYIEAAEFIDAGDHVVVPTHQWGKSKTSGTTVGLDVTIVYSLREGKIVALREYDTLDQALEAVGLSE